MEANQPTIHCDRAGCRSRCALDALDVQINTLAKELAKRGWVLVPPAAEGGGPDKHFCPVHKATATNP